MCQIHHVTITEELADKLTPETKDNGVYCVCVCVCVCVREREREMNI